MGMLSIVPRVAPSSMPVRAAAPSLVAPLECCIHSCHGHGRCVDGRCTDCPSANEDDFDCSLPPAPLPRGVVWPGAEARRARYEAAATSGERCPHGRPHGLFIGVRGLRISEQEASFSKGRRGLQSGVCRQWPVRTLEPGLSGIYAPLDVFLLRLLDDPALRAPSAACAQAEWHPLFAQRHYGNVDEEFKWKLKAALASRRAVHTAPPAGEVAGDGPHAPPPARTPAPRSALPHIHEEHQDMGACGAPAGLYWPGDVILTYWGARECHPADTSAIVLPGGSRTTPRIERTPRQWLSVDAELVRLARDAYSPQRMHAPRERVLFFRGAVREGKAPPDVAAACLDPATRRSDDRRCRDGLYSLGIRQAVWRLHGRHPLVRFNANVTGRPRSYPAEMRASEWCLTSPGMGFGVRIVYAVAAGCLPVVVRPGQLRLPYEPELDYEGFAVTLPFRDIDSLPAILGAMSDAAIRAKRERLRQVHRMFLWDAAYGTAYETTRDLLLRRLNGSGATGPQV